ncbi:Hypothetical predicted protein [Cloeon dipterum]|nr:Hypothetical predicted protein [Cloeon dipterum]
MWFDEVESIAELFRGYLPYYLVIALPIFIIISPANPVAASHEFPVYRMQQFDLHGVQYGCRSAPINMEAKALSTWSSSRHCVISKIQDLSMERFKEISEKAGALVVVLPSDLTALSIEDRQNILELEDLMMEREVSIPVYFTHWNPSIDDVLTDLSTTIPTTPQPARGSALETLMHSVSANGYQIVVNTHQSHTRTDVSVANIQGKLGGHGMEDKLPTVAIVAHYDSFGVAPDLAFGADSNGSGVAVLIELARIFSQLYSSQRTHAKFNLMFLLSGAGKLNYQGTKKWLEDHIDSIDGSPLQNAHFVICLDALSSGKDIYVHYSKPPKEGTATSNFFQELTQAAKELNPEVKVELMHKKINLADKRMFWEHERLSMKRMAGFTVSALKSHQDYSRATILDNTIDTESIAQKASILSEALARYIYNLSAEDVFTENLKVDETAIEGVMDFLVAQPRAAQVLATKQNSLVTSLQSVLSRYLKDVKVSHLVPDKRDPDFSFYDVTKATVNVYSVKPAVFDLFLTFAIVAYLGLSYLCIQNFSLFYGLVARVSVPAKSKVQ